MLATLQRIATMMDVEELEASPVLTTGAAVSPTAPEEAASEAPVKVREAERGG
jgi:hypothetical protein